MRFLLPLFISFISFNACAADSVKRCVDCSPGEETVVILHKGDAFPAVGVLYSYDSKETEKDFVRRRKELEALQAKQEYKHEMIEATAKPKCKT